MKTTLRKCLFCAVRSLFAVAFFGAGTLTTQGQPTLAVSDGWASQNGGTTGGGNATPITVTTAAAFKAAAENNTPAVIIVQGRLDVGTMSIGSNKTIVGADTNSGLYGGSGISVDGANYIFQNLIFGPATGDVMEISGGRNIFITKCEFFGSTDELCSIVRQADFVTISWSKFYFPNSASHSFAHLIGNRDDATDDRGKLRVTLHHNWYAEGLQGRLPRVRFGQVHIYNNYYNAIDTGYCIGIGVECHIRLENSHFHDSDNPWEDYGGTSSGEIGWAGLKFEGSILPTFMPNAYATIFTPPYPYTLDPVDSVRSIVTDPANGAGNVFGSVAPPSTPLISISRSTINVFVEPGQNATAELFQVWNSGTNVLNYSAQEDTAWFSVSPENGSSSNASQKVTHTIAFTTAGLALGHYDGSIQINAPGATNTPVTIPVSLEIAPLAPVIGLGVSNLTVKTIAGSNALETAFNIFNAGNGTLNYTLTPQAAWFAVAPLSDTATGAGDPQTHTVTFNNTALPVGTYFSWVEVSAPAAVPPTAYLPVVLQVREPGGFTAYNDLSWGSGQLSNHITMHTTATGGGGGNGGGALLDHATGLPAGVTLAITGGSWDGPANHISQGANANSGTDAYEVFNSKVDCTGVLSYDVTELALTFSNLVPTVRYEVVLFGNRAQYTDRFTTVTLEGAASFTNTSTLGAAISGSSSETTRILNGHNTVNGYVARYAGIDPGADGVFTLRTLPGTTVAERYYVNALMLRGGELPVPQVQLHPYVAGQLALTLDGVGMVLEEAPAITGPWTVCTNQTPVQVLIPNQPAKFFKLRTP